MRAAGRLAARSAWKAVSPRPVRTTRLAGVQELTTIGGFWSASHDDFLCAEVWRAVGVWAVRRETTMLIVELGPEQVQRPALVALAIARSKSAWARTGARTLSVSAWLRCRSEANLRTEV